MAKKFYVIDTSVFLSDADCLFKFENNDIIIPIKVLEEIDKHKKRQDSVGFNARMIIKHLDNLREKGSLCSGFRIDKGTGILRVVSDTSDLPRDLDPTIPEMKYLQQRRESKKKMKKRKLLLFLAILICELLQILLGYHHRIILPSRLLMSEINYTLDMQRL